MKIAITNTVVLNTGDAAILLALLKLIREAFDTEIHFVVFDNNPSLGEKYYPEITFKEWPIIALSKIEYSGSLTNLIEKLNKLRFYLGAWLFKYKLSSLATLLLSPREKDVIKEYLSADIIISTGGTYLVENYSLGARIFDFRLTLLLGKPLFFFTQSLGPFTVPDHREKLLRIFEQAKVILLRDARSQKYLKEIGLQKNNNYVVSDSAFALANLEKVQIAKSAKISSVKPKVAISVREWAYFKEVDPKSGTQGYVHAICQAVTYLVEKYEAEVTFISTCQGIPAYRDDSKFVDEVIIPILSAEILKSVKVNRDFHRPEDLVQELQGFDFVISTRLHMVILSLGTGIPVLPIAYEFKTQELFDALGFPDLVLDIEKISTQEICSKIDLLINSQDELRDKIFSGVIDQYYSAISAGELIKNKCGKTLKP